MDVEYCKYGNAFKRWIQFFHDLCVTLVWTHDDDDDDLDDDDDDGDDDDDDYYDDDHDEAEGVGLQW